MAYDDGEVRQEFSVCSHARVVGGEAREDGSEMKEVRWVESGAGYPALPGYCGSLTATTARNTGRDTPQAPRRAAGQPRTTNQPRHTRLRRPDSPPTAHSGTR
jgi:hypothetical protein